MDKSIFKITQMDCPSEESLIRMKLDSVEGIKALDFNISDRKLTVFHEGNLPEIEIAINKLKLGDQLISSEKTEDVKMPEDKSKANYYGRCLL